MTNHPDDISYPRCSQCHEDLVRCPACRHYEAGECHHPREAERYTPDGDAAKDCPSFRSRNEVRDIRMQWDVPAPVWVSSLLLVILLSLAVAAWFIDPALRYFRGNPLYLKHNVPPEVAVGQMFNIKMFITNPMNTTSTRYYIEIGEKFMAGVMPGVPMPEPLSVGHYRNRLVLEYDPLPSNSSQLVLLPFKALKKGTLSFSARIYAPRNQLVQIVEATAVQVKDPGVAAINNNPALAHQKMVRRWEYRPRNFSHHRPQRMRGSAC